jgi:RNA polymerase sigma-70 factor (ECF subfamily)
MSDEALMAAYQRGDLGAFEALVERHERRLWNFLRRFVRDATVAEDLLQEVFLRVVKSAPQWRPSAKVTTWMFTIARNLCIDHARAAVHRKAASLDSTTGPAGEEGAPWVERLPGSGVGAEEAMRGRQLADELDAALATLPVEQREVFLLREVMEMPFAEIAATVGAPEPTVKSRLRYALESLRAALEEFQEGGAAAERAGQRT